MLILFFLTPTVCNFPGMARKIIERDEENERDIREKKMRERARDEKKNEREKRAEKKKLTYLATIMEKNARAFWCGSPRFIMGIYQSYHWKGMLCEIFSDSGLIHNILKLIHLIHCSCLLGSYDFALVIANCTRIRI